MWIFLGPRKKQKDFLTTEVAKDLARHSRNRNSDYLAQRRKGRKDRKITLKKFFKIIHIVPLNLACFAAWRESIPVFEYSRYQKVCASRASFQACSTKIRRLDKGEGLNLKKNGFFLRAFRGDIPFLVAALPP